MCGGLIHPIAGRCKHCKQDLSALRGARPAAAAQLPSLNGGAAYPYAGNGHAAAHAAAPAPAPAAPAPRAAPARPATVHPANAHMAVPIARHEEPSQPILPPRPTGRMYASQPQTATWKSWPVLVIVLAAIAIVTAVVLMLWPPDSKKANAGTLPPPPAPERMDTNPIVPSAPQGIPDPWSRNGGGGSTPSPYIDPPPADPDPVPPPDDLADLFGPGAGGPTGGLGGTTLSAPSLSSMERLMSGIVHRLCERAPQCPGVDAATARQTREVCQTLETVYPKRAAPTCPAAQRCLAAVEDLACKTDVDIGVLGTILATADDCRDAMSC